MITRIVKMTIRSEAKQQFSELFEKHRTLISNMPGCQRLQLLEDTELAGVFYTISVWQSAAQLEKYRESEVFNSLWPQVKALFNAPAVAWSMNEILPPTNPSYLQ